MSSTESNSSTSGQESPAQQRTIKSGGQGMIEVVKSAYEAAENAHAIVICTEWDEFKDDQLDYNKIYEKMETDQISIISVECLSLNEEH